MRGQVHVYLSDEERAAVARYASRRGLTRSAAIREIVAKAIDRDNKEQEEIRRQLLEGSSLSVANFV